MLINRKTLTGIRAGHITTVFRKWKRPTVTAEGTLRTEVGVLAIDSIEKADASALTRADAESAGFASLEELQEWLDDERPGTLFRIKLRYLGADPRIDLRGQSDLSPDDMKHLEARLLAIDKRNPGGPSSQKLLNTIASHPATRATELAGVLRIDPDKLKRRVSALKELGLTESLQPGYRLSPRGKALLEKLSIERSQSGS